MGITKTEQLAEGRRYNVQLYHSRNHWQPGVAIRAATGVLVVAIWEEGAWALLHPGACAEVVEAREGEP